ncbi:NAD(P)-binding protein [Lophium mytilinum]|uniref:NAD(P)-binding protein n=1 Tax=Lophium mytilinum TaxID=390894 RepID=A0A6A6QPM9_9PEZI|nr:NAD(P)-binding protein [Lophium mytilinum]
MHIKTIAIVGPRGNVGTALITELLADPTEFTITALTRPNSPYTPQSPDIKVTEVDFTSLDSLIAALSGQDAIAICIPGGAVRLDSQKLLLDAAIAAGVKLFFADEYVSDIRNPAYVAMPAQFVGDKIAVRAMLEERSAKGEISWTALNGGPFFDMWLTKGPAGFDIPNRLARIYGTGDNQACWTPLPVMGRAAANMLRNPDPILNRAVFISGVKGLSQNALLAALEEQVGKFEVTHVDVKKIKLEAEEAGKRGDIGKWMKGMTVNSNFNEEESHSDFWHLVENELVGVEVVSVGEAVKETLERCGRDVKVVEALFRVGED